MANSKKIKPQQKPQAPAKADAASFPVGLHYDERHRWQAEAFPEENAKILAFCMQRFGSHIAETLSLLVGGEYSVAINQVERTSSRALLTRTPWTGLEKYFAAKRFNNVFVRDGVYRFDTYGVIRASSTLLKNIAEAVRKSEEATSDGMVSATAFWGLYEGLERALTFAPRYEFSVPQFVFEESRPDAILELDESGIAIIFSVSEEGSQSGQFGNLLMFLPDPVVYALSNFHSGQAAKVFVSKRLETPINLRHLFTSALKQTLDNLHRDELSDYREFVTEVRRTVALQPIERKPTDKAGTATDKTRKRSTKEVPPLPDAAPTLWKNRVGRISPPEFIQQVYAEWLGENGTLTRSVLRTLDLDLYQAYAQHIARHPEDKDLVPQGRPLPESWVEGVVQGREIGTDLEQDIKDVRKFLRALERRQAKEKAEKHR